MSGSGQKIRQSPVQTPEFPLESGILRTRRQHPLAREKLGGKLAKERFQGKGRGRDEGRSTQGTTQAACEVGLSLRVGCGGVEGAGPALLDRCQDHPHQVAAVDPAPPLRAISKRSTHAEAKRRQHLFECAAFAVQNDPDTQAGDIETEVGRFDFLE